MNGFGKFVNTTQVCSGDDSFSISYGNKGNHDLQKCLQSLRHCILPCHLKPLQSSAVSLSTLSTFCALRGTPASDACHRRVQNNSPQLSSFFCRKVLVMYACNLNCASGVQQVLEKSVFKINQWNLQFLHSHSRFYMYTISRSSIVYCITHCNTRTVYLQLCPIEMPHTVESNKTLS